MLVLRCWLFECRVLGSLYYGLCVFWFTLRVSCGLVSVGLIGFAMRDWLCRQCVWLGFGGIWVYCCG